MAGAVACPADRDEGRNAVRVGPPHRQRPQLVGDDRADGGRLDRARGAVAGLHVILGQTVLHLAALHGANYGQMPPLLGEPRQAAGQLQSAGRRGDRSELQPQLVVAGGLRVERVLLERPSFEPQEDHRLLVGGRL